MNNIDRDDRIRKVIGFREIVDRISPNKWNRNGHLQDGKYTKDTLYCRSNT